MLDEVLHIEAISSHFQSLEVDPAVLRIAEACTKVAQYGMAFICLQVDNHVVCIHITMRNPCVRTLTQDRRANQ